MALVTAESLFEDVKAGKKLSSTERRHVLSWLDFYKRGEYTTSDLAKKFQVNERTVRSDRDTIRRKFAKDIKKDIDVTLIIADIELTFRHIMMELNMGLRQTKPGRNEHLQYCKTILQTQLEVAKSYQDLGILPKNLGVMQQQSYRYVAIVNQDGSVTSQEVKTTKELSEDAAAFLEGKAGNPKRKVKQLPEVIEAVKEDGEEYTFKTVVPSPLVQ